ncbi:hypothetical protein HPP92_015347 [Vanilla planifolia]|uniref:KOW domain-containing protein n=1 Tax=Vanilla planifolia TaxID=51239 RepID=A0A835UXR4_VANPL|nr:hypothetical protein HPP92_015347 [Vanilla planifolia]
MAVKGKGKQGAGKAPASSPSSSFKRKIPATEAETSRARRKKRRSGVLQFVDDAAGEAEIDEMKEDDELEWEDYDDVDVGLGENDVKSLTKVPIKSSSLPVFIKQEEMDDDELEEAIKQRYCRGSDFVSYAEDVKEFDDSEYLVHTPEDLSIWRVKCMIGRERQAAFCLMQKFVDLQKIGKVLQIFSVISFDHVKGFVYIEADKACNVFEACKGLCFLYSSRVDLVPRNEAPNLLSIQSKVSGISKGMWVRMKSGTYKGDLAEVVSMNDVKKRVTIKLVPRIDLQAIAKKFGGGTSLKTSDIPAPRLISSHELEDFRPQIEVRRDRETGEIFEVLDGLMLKDGYLYKKVSTCSLIYWGVQPSAAELMKFENMGKDEVKDTSWLSSVYKARMKKKESETSDPKDGDKSNHNGGCKSNGKDTNKHNRMDGDKQRCTFDLDDLVLFGKKDFGIVVDKENDTVKILKGDIDGPEVVSINAWEIKKNCVDKVFAAPDRSSKLVNIDDVVKVAEGALEGREGIVKHMYKGILFIYDECQAENNGFFHAKSNICDLLKKSRDYFGKKGFKASPSFSQSANRFPNEEEENSQNFGRGRQVHSRGTFSVGQTLRICKGPLKGYICRVVRIHRADVTVKLDSLAKLLTVDEKLLSLPTSRFEETTTQGDMFGSQNGQSTGVKMDEGNAMGTDNDKLTTVMSSFGRDSWNAPSSSSFQFQGNNENKDSSGGWDKAGNGAPKGSNGGWSTGDDGWNKAAPKLSTVSSTEADRGRDTKDASAKLNNKGDGNDKAEGFSKPLGNWSSPNGGDGPDPWGMKVKGGESSKDPSTSGNHASGWDQPSNWSEIKSAPGSAQWGTSEQANASEAVGWKESTDGKLATGWSASSAPSVEAGNQGNRWEKSDGLNSSGWANDEQASSSETGGWNKASNADSAKDRSDSWAKSKAFVGNDWHKDHHDDKFEQPKDAGWGQGSGWSQGGSKNESSKDWCQGSGRSHEGSNNESSENWGQGSGWSQGGIGNEGPKDWAQRSVLSQGGSKNESSKDWSQGSGWSQGGSENESSKDWGQGSGWSQRGSGNEGAKDCDRGLDWSQGGSKSESSKYCDQGSGWSQGGFKNESSPNWGKGSSWSRGGSKNESSIDCGQGSGWSQGGFKNESSTNWGQSSGWSQGGFKSENSKNWSQDNNQNKQRDFGGERGSFRGRGRGRFGGRGDRNEDNSDNGGSWRFGRGGRGQNRPGDDTSDNFDGSRKFDYGRGRGEGRGRGRGEGRGRWRGEGRGRWRGEGRGRGWRQFDSSDSRNRRDDFGGGFSSKPSSSWGNEGGSGWGKASPNNAENSVVTLDEKIGWNGEKSFGGFGSSEWGTGHQDVSGSKTESNVECVSNWSKNIGHGCSSDASFADWVKDQSEPKSNTADDKWKGEKPGLDSNASRPPSKDNNKWGTSKDWVDNNSSDWGGEAKGTFSNRSSEWNNNAGDEWSKQKRFDAPEQSMFNESLDGFQAQSRNWNHGSDFGRGRSSGGRWRGNSFYNRGRGRGRSSVGHWNGDDKRQSFNSTQEESWNRGNKGSFDHGRGSWSSQTGNQPDGWAKQHSGWTSVSVASEGENSSSVINLLAETEENNGRNDDKGGWEGVNSGKTESDWVGKPSSWRSEPSPAKHLPRFNLKFPNVKNTAMLLGGMKRAVLGAILVKLVCQ